MPNKWTIISVIGLCLLFIALQWNSFNAPFERDEGSYAYGAWLMTQNRVPYVDTFEHKPPLIYLPYLLAFFIDAAALWPVRLLAFLSFALTVGLVGVFVIRPNRRWPLIPAAILGVVTLAEIFRVATIIPPGLQPLFVPAILIAVGGYLILAPRL